MHLVGQPEFQIHWSVLPSGDAGELAPPGTRLLVIWPAPVDHDSCFKAAGFTVFADNDEAWDQAAEGLLERVIGTLSGFGASKLVSVPLRDEPPWYLRPFRSGAELPLLQQALLPMQHDSLPWFHAQFGGEGAALRTGAGHFLLWVSLPETVPEPAEFVRTLAQTAEVIETSLRWNALLPRSKCAL